MGDFLPRVGGWRKAAKLALAALAVTAMTSVPAHGRDTGTMEAYPALEGLRFGLSVTDLEGNVLLAHRADERFIPASVTKLFVTAAALAAEAELAALDSGLRLVLEPHEGRPPTLVLVGRGDPSVGFGEACETRCIETLARAAAEAGITEVGNIVGDDSWFADERKPLGWSWDDLKFGHGTAISAIAVNENVVPLRVSPSGAPGSGVSARWPDDGAAYFNLHNEATTGNEDGEWALRLERRTGEQSARLYGELPLGSRPVTLKLGVDNPAHLAAWHFRRALESEGVTVSGELLTRRRPLQYADEPRADDPDNPVSPMRCANDAGDYPEGRVIASLPPAPLDEVVTMINRDSQNLYAEVLLRQLGRVAGTGSSFCGLLQIRELMDEMGVPRASHDIADGSGLSNYNRATPATITALLRHAAAAPWGEAFRESLPIGGHPNGTLKFRFRGTPLEGKVFAKTGTLNHVDALSGYMLARSGRMLAFSIIVNDRPLASPSARSAIDAVLVDIAEQY